MFSDIDISQGSVSTPLRCGEICNNLFTVNFLISATVKNFQNWPIFGELMDKSLVFCFLTHGIAIFSWLTANLCQSVACLQQT